MKNNTAPGTCEEDIPAAAEPIEGVGTSTVAFIGGALDGPILEPTLVTTWDQFVKKFGGLDQSSKGCYLGYAVSSFFANQGQRAYIVRVKEVPSAEQVSRGGRPEIAYRNGLPCLEALEDVDLVAIPEATDMLDQQALVEHCEKMRNRFAIIDSAPEPNKVGDSHDVKLQISKIESFKGYAALYYPWIQVQDPDTKRILVIPPSGAVAGIFARNDMQKGVYKAPTNEVVIGVLDTEVSVDQTEMNEFNRLGVNVIRKFTGRGIVVWGARTTSGDPIWKYVSIRRTMIYLEQSIAKGTEWVTFEPNDEITWTIIKRSIQDFLTTSWTEGMLSGTIPEQAFFVRCDRTTMTQADIDNGKLIAEVGVALTRPSEFQIVHIVHDMEKVGPRNLSEEKCDTPKKYVKKHWYRDNRSV
jgi:hypothetical protein